MSRTKLFTMIVVTAAVLAIPLLAFAAPAQVGPITVTLSPLNNSGESGTATLTDLGNNQTKVVIAVTGEPSGASQPVHVHTGQCGPTLGGVVFPLSPVVNGASTTTISTTLSAIMDGNHAINGHKSAAEITVYVFCGNIPKANAAAATTAPTAMATTAATTAATPAATGTGTAPTTAPTTGSGDAGTLLVPMLTIALMALGAGLLMRRVSAK